MKDYVIRPAAVEDAHRIAPLLREQDRLELKAASGAEPEVVVPRAFDGPPGPSVFAETISGQPIMIAGVRPYLPNIGLIWMVGTQLLAEYAFRCGREARRHVDLWNEEFPLLWNTAWTSNDLHIRWLRFMKFSLLRKVEHNGHLFVEFARHRHVR